MKKTTIFNYGIGKPNFGLPFGFGLPKNVNASKPKNFGLPLVYRLVYRESPINKGISVKVNQVNQNSIKECWDIVINKKIAGNRHTTRVRAGIETIFI